MDSSQTEQSPLKNGGLVGTLDRLLIPVEDLLNVIAAFTIFAVMIGTTLQTFGRIAGYPFPGYLEASEQAIAVFAFLGAAYAQRMGAHIRMEMLIGRSNGRGRWLAEAVGTLLSMMLIAVLIRYSWDFFHNAWSIGDTTYDYNIPTWPSKLLVPVAFTIWFLRLSVELLGYLRLFITPDADPVGVPIIKSAAEIAQDEITETFGRES